MPKLFFLYFLARGDEAATKQWRTTVNNGKATAKQGRSIGATVTTAAVAAAATMSATLTTQKKASEMFVFLAD